MDRANGPITGIIFVRCGATVFPEAAWSDFPVVILGWWHRAALSLVTGSKSERFMFMDGPYRFDVTAEHPSIWTLRFLRDNQALGEARVEGKDFIREILRAGNISLRACMAKDWIDSDIRGLEHGRSELQRHARRRR